MKNTMSDLHNHLMARIEALGDEDLSGEGLDAEIKRATATCSVAGTMIDNARLVLAAEKHFAELGAEPPRRRLPMLTTRDGNG